MAVRFHSLDDPELIILINRGCVGVIPTDTVYGLVAKAGDEAAIRKLYSTKERPSQPGTTIGESIWQFEQLGFPYEPLARANHYWPAPLSVVIDATDIPLYLKVDRTSLPVRIPDSRELLDLLATTGPLMTTSANHPGEPTATSIDAAVRYFGDEIDFYVDAGDLGNRPPSTIIGFDADGLITVYRQGAITIK